LRKIGTIANVYENGQMQVVEDDVLNIVRKLRDISTRLTVYWNDHINQFTITETSLDGAEERLVFNVPELDERVVDRILVADQWHGREDPTHILSENEDFLTAVESDEERIDREKTERERDIMGGVIEELASYADLDGRGTKASILIPKGVRSVPDGAA
jgi:hypothetical protein